MLNLKGSIEFSGSDTAQSTVAEQKYQKVLPNDFTIADDHDDDDNDEEKGSISMDYDEPIINIPNRSLFHLFGINAFGFVYGLLISTFGLIILPLESEKLWPDKQALLLALFLAICGISQLSGPVAGYFSDRCTHPMGRRRPYFLMGAGVGIISLLALRWASFNNNLGVYLFFFLVAMLGLNVMYTSYQGVLTDLVNESQRGIANGLMGALTVLGASAGFGCFSTFLDLETAYGFYAVLLVAAAIISLAAYNETPADADTYIQWTWKEIKDCYWIDPTEHKDFFLVFCSRTLYYMGVSIQTFMLFYFRDVIHSSDPQTDVSYLALVGQLSGALVCVPMGLLSDKFGRKVLIYASSAIIVCAYVGFMFTRERNAALLVGALYGIGNGTYLSVDYALACDTLPSKDQAARYLGIWGVGAFIGTLLGPMLIGPALLWFGGSGNIDGAIGGTAPMMYEPAGYVGALVIGSVCMTLGAVVLAPIRSAR